MSNSEFYQISFYAENLPNVAGWFGKSSPYAKVKVKSGRHTNKDLGETEYIERTLDPDWCKIFILDFSDSEITNLEVTIFGHKNGREPIWIGEAHFEATSVFQSEGKTQWKQIGRRENSKLFCHVEKSRLGPATGSFKLHLRGLDMKNVEPGAFGLGRSDPFFEISKKDADYSIAQVKWNVVYRSKPIEDNLNPYWAETQIGIEELCYGKLDWPLKVEVFDHNDNGNHESIGSFETTVLDLQERIAVKGNADREQAIAIGKATKTKRYGLVCVLEASVVPDDGQMNV